jgi:NADH dehydrogenase (ubiquinone) 1 beta subcomplex subunit 8
MPSCEWPTDRKQNGGYVNPPAVKRQLRDPYADWWDKQERRNYGEPVHEDNDIMGMFSPEDYRHVTPGTAWFQLSCFAAAVFALCGAVYVTYPDKPSAPRTFPGGLEEELGGPGAVPVGAIMSSSWAGTNSTRHAGTARYEMGPSLFVHKESYSIRSWTSITEFLLSTTAFAIWKPLEIPL